MSLIVNYPLFLILLDSEMLYFSYGFGGKNLMTSTKESKMFKGASIGFGL